MLKHHKFPFTWKSEHAVGHIDNLIFCLVDSPESCGSDFQRCFPLDFVISNIDEALERSESTTLDDPRFSSLILS